MTQRSAFVLKVRPDRIEEYIEAHRNVWPELLDALRAAGVRNYTIFRRANETFGYFESEDLEAAGRDMAAQEVNARWQDALAGRDGGAARGARAGRGPGGARGSLSARVAPASLPINGGLKPPPRDCESSVGADHAFSQKRDRSPLGSSRAGKSDHAVLPFRDPIAALPRGMTET